MEAEGSTPRLINQQIVHKNAFIQHKKSGEPTPLPIESTREAIFPPQKE